MTDRNRVSYSKKMRDGAKASGKMLFTIDFDTENFRTTLQGPICQERALIVRRAMLLLNGMDEAQVEEHLKQYPEAE